MCLFSTAQAPRFVSTFVVAMSMAVFGCGDRVDNNININVTDSAGADTTPADTTGTDTAVDARTDTTSPSEMCVTEGGFGCACDNNIDCNSTRCIEGPDGRMCTQECITECPDGFDCRAVGGPGDGASVCVARHVSLCRPCSEATDCRLGGDTTALCIPAANADEGSFCATSCASLACPSGYRCEEVTVGDGTATSEVCVPENGATCDCRPSWTTLGLETTCFSTNPVGRCAGIRTCTIDGLGACSAASASVEVCDGADNDCNGVDDDIAPEPCELATTGIDTTCAGTTVCVDGATGCAGRAPAPEICDGLDNDCDAQLDESTSNCLDAGCTRIPGGAGYVQNGAPSCHEGGCVYANPLPCGYYTCSDGGAAGEVCAQTCSDDTRCIANATCVAGACRCATGYSGPSCEVCATGYQDADRDGVCAPDCTTTPCVQGLCDDSSGTAICACFEGHIGDACDACDAPNYTDPDGDGACVIRGDVLLGPAPSTVARVGKVYRFTMQATQDGFMPDDAFVYTLEAGPATMAMDPASGEIAWTPASSDQTWNADPTLSEPFTLRVRATAPDGQFAEHIISLEVLPQVFVERMHPAAGSGRGGEPVLVFGSGFVEPANAPGDISVAFGAIPAATMTIIDEHTLAITTPAAAALTRPLNILLSGDPEVALSPGFTHLPVLEFANTTSMTIGGNLTLTGAGFDSEVLVGNTAAFASRGVSTRIVKAATVSNGAEATFALGVSLEEATFGTGAMSLVINGLRSNHLPITISDSPLVPRMAVTSTSGAVAAGNTVRLRGAGFSGLAASDIAVSFTGPDGPVAGSVASVAANGQELTVNVPAGATTGLVSLTATGRAPATSFVPVIVTGTEPVLQVHGMTPDVAAPGQAIVIVGQGFDAPTVEIDGVEAEFLSVEPNRLVVRVPAGARAGAAALVVKQGGATSETHHVGVTSATIERIAGGATMPVPETADPFGAPLPIGAAVAHPTGLLIVGDGLRIRAINGTNAPINAFGVITAPGTTTTIAAGAPTHMAVRPLGGDIFYSEGNRIRRLRQADGQVLDYAGQESSGNSGNDGYRTAASFASPQSVAFTSDNILLISDYLNGPIRAINTAGATATHWGIQLPPDIVKVVEPFGPQNALGLAVDRDDSLYIVVFTTIFRIPNDRLPPTDPEHIGRIRVAGAGGAGAPTTGCPASGAVLGTNNVAFVDPETGDLFVGSRHGIVRRIIAGGGLDETHVDENDCIEDYAGLPLTDDGVPQPGNDGDGGPAGAARIALLPRPMPGNQGEMLIVGNGMVRRVALSEAPSERTITTLGGRLPAPVDGLLATELDSMTSPTNVVVDDANDRWLMSFRNFQIVAVDRTTRAVSLVAGTGLAGNAIAPDGAATRSDLAALRGMALVGGRHLYFLEAIIPRIASVDLVTGQLTVRAGDGRQSTSAEDNTAGLAAETRVHINTGRPKITATEDGLVYFGNSNLVRVINTTDSPRTTFGLSIPAGGIATLPNTLGSNVSRIAFDRDGTMWVASLVANRLAVLRPSAPTTVERIIPADGLIYGRMPTGRLADLRLPGITDLAFTARGDLLIVPLSAEVLYLARANAEGRVTADSLVTVIGGVGVDGELVDDRAFNAQSLTFSAIAVDGNAALVGVGSTVARINLP